MESLIPPSQHWALGAILLGSAAFGLWAEQTGWGGKLSGAVITLLTTATLSNLGILPITAPAYDLVWSYLVPLAIPLLLFTADLRRIFREAGAMLIAFLAGAGGTILGVLFAFSLVPLGPEGWKLAAIFCATYIGGSINYAAVAEAVELRSSDLLAAGAAADNLMMTVYFLVLFTLPSLDMLRQYYPDHRAADTPAPLVVAQSQGEENGHPVPLPEPLRATGALALAATMCALGFGIAALLDLGGGAILIVTALAVTAATVAPSRLEPLAGASWLGIVFMQVFFAAVGASANIQAVVKVGAVLFVFAAAILSVHLLVILIAGKLAGLTLPEIVVASNANMGGPTTAAAMAAARKWGTLVLPAILCGTLGYAMANIIGILVGTWLARVP